MSTEVYQNKKPLRFEDIQLLYTDFLFSFPGLTWCVNYAQIYEAPCKIKDHMHSMMIYILPYFLWFNIASSN